MQSLYENQRAFFNHGTTLSLDFRLSQLKILRKAIKENEPAIAKALYKDLGKSCFESYETEIGFVLSEIRHTIRHLSKWTKPQKVKTPIMHFLSRSFTTPEPYGVSLILSPWNYPFQLTMAPLIGSIAAGNCNIIKPSAYSHYTSSLLQKMLENYYDENYISVILGGRETNQTLLDQKFDYIFFTGSVSVGKTVMEKASHHLTPITLELGGKSPCIVDETADLSLAAKRIVWGKFLNAGQTCVAPDYILVQKSSKDELISQIKKWIPIFYGSKPLENSDYPKIINEKHFNRLTALLSSGDIVFGGKFSASSFKIEPTIIETINWNSPLMQEEIFGPLLPILTFDTIEDVIAICHDKPKPLALYLFSTDKKHQKQVLNHISFGGGCINDTIVHLATSSMPFGGVGASGTGSYHGKKSFDTFSHQKSILVKSNLLDVPLRYPPFDNHLSILKKIMK